MASNPFLGYNRQLVVPLEAPVQESQGFNEYPISSVSLPNDVAYQNMAKYSDAASPMSDGANFQKNISINIESYQNLPSSPLSFSSSNVNPIRINQEARRRGREHHELSSHFTEKEMELLDCLPQLYKKPRLDAHADYYQQKKILWQQHNLQKLQQIERLQSIPQYMRISTQQQMRHYLQQRVKNSVPAIIPFRSGICSRRLTQFLYHLQHRPADNSIAYWRKFVAEYFAVRAKKRWCLSLYSGVGERALGVFSQLAMETWHCDMCGSKSGKGFEVDYELLPRIYKTYFESGVLDELLFLDLPHEYVLHSGLILLRYEKAVQETIYEKFRVVREGQLRIIFRSDLKIIAWEFCARCHEEVVPRSLVAPQVNELVQAAEKCQSKGGSSGVAVQNLQSTCKMFIAKEGQLVRNLDSLLVNDLGFPKRYIRCLQVAEIVNSMKDLMTFSLDNNIGPIESLTKYSRKGTVSNSQKQAEFPATSEAVVSGLNEGMSSHHNMQICTSNSEKQNSNTNAVYSPRLGPKFTSQNLIQRSPVSCSSSSTFSEFDNKIQEQMIDKILQQMESNTRKQANISKCVKVKEEVIENYDKAPTTDVGTRNIGKGIIGNASTAVWRSVGKNGSNMRESSKSAPSNICVKQEKDIDDIYMGLYLPEAIGDVDCGFFCLGALNDGLNDIGLDGKH